MIKDLFFLVAFFEFYSCTDFWSGVCFWISQLSPLYWALVHNMKQSQSAWPGLLLDETDWKIDSRNKSNPLQAISGCSAPMTTLQLVQSKSLKIWVKQTSGSLFSIVLLLFYFTARQLSYSCRQTLGMFSHFLEANLSFNDHFPVFSSCAM